ncbi:putative GS homeobox 2-like [Homarus americanus]|uniref:Putative GS homeobox 2-like n=1 Tax=Homarus americanus TaxID=6706 RepID=A0A8J5KCD8_HOMAM|nr:putative GS homeobox 2-like [Homarus americanus]
MVGVKIWFQNRRVKYKKEEGGQSREKCSCLRTCTASRSRSKDQQGSQGCDSRSSGEDVDDSIHHQVLSVDPGDDHLKGDVDCDKKGNLPHHHHHLHHHGHHHHHHLPQHPDEQGCPRQEAAVHCHDATVTSTDTKSPSGDYKPPTYGSDAESDYDRDSNENIDVV